MKNLVLGLMTPLALGAAADTYWAKAAASGATPPKCFVWYADEACTQAATVSSAPAPDLDGFTTFTVNLAPSGHVILLK